MTGVAAEEAEGSLLIRALAAYDGVIGDPQRVGPTAVRLVTAARAAGDVEAQVVAMRAVAWFERSRLANRKAIALLDAAVDLARQAGLPHRQGEALVTRAAVALELGRTGSAQRDLERAGPLVDAAAAPDLELKRAALLHNLGRIAAAAEVNASLLTGPDVLPDVRMRAANNLALEEALLGKTSEALRRIDRAAELAAGVGPAAAAVVAHNRGLVLAQHGRLAESLHQFDQAQDMLRVAGLPLGEFLVEHAATLADLRALKEAFEVAERASAELAAGDVPLMAAQARLQVAEIALLRGDVAVAREMATGAAAEFRAQRRPGWRAMATVVAVEADVRGGVVDAAGLAAVRRAADTLLGLGLGSSAVHANLVTGRAALALGRAALARRRLMACHERSRRGAVLMRLQGSHAAALAAADPAARLAHCRSGLADLARHRAALGSMELRALASDHGVELGLLGLGVLMRTGRPAQILDWLERTRAAALLTVEPATADVVRDELAELATVHEEIGAARRASGADPDELLARQRSIEQRIRRATWHRSSSGLRQGAVVTGRQLRAALGGRSLVSYGAHGGELFAVVVRDRRTTVHRLGPVDAVRFETDTLLFGLRRLTRPGPDRVLASSMASAQHALGQLARLLIRPLGLDPQEPLVVVSLRSLARVPWSALHDGPVALAPSATSWVRTTGAEATGGRVVVVGGPGLPGADREVKEVAQHHPQAQVLLPPRSTPDAVLAEMAGADLVHLACHGLLRADNPTFSALELTDGRLTVHELDLRGIAPRRIVLAACDSAADTVYAGDELIGFVSALLARGTAGIVASVVVVGDVESVDLMAGLHAELAAGASMADALHTARAGVDRADPRQFVNWCAFTAYGAG